MNEPLIPAAPIILLTYRVPAPKRPALYEFLTRAKTIYERPGGIRIALYESVDDPELVCELVGYATLASFEADQERVENDHEMKATLAEWRKLVGGHIEVRRLRPVWP